VEDLQKKKQIFQKSIKKKYYRDDDFLKIKFE